MSGPRIAGRGALFVVAAPSGAGKTSLVKAALEQDRRLSVSVSFTTRGRRPTERDGVNYHFTDHDRFEAMIAKGAFLEHARVFGNYYGTSSAWVDETRELGRDVILEIDWQGAQQIRRLRPETVGIFIMPPSRAALEERLRGRGEDDPGAIERRLAEATEEMSHHVEFDYLIVNDSFETATNDLLAIFRAERARLARAREASAALLAGLLDH